MTIPPNPLHSLTRLAAFVLDLLLVAIVGSVLCLPLSGYFTKHPAAPDWILFILCLLYFAIFDSSAVEMPSPGRRALGIVLVPTEPLTPLQAMLRKAMVLFPLFNRDIGALAIFTSPGWTTISIPLFFGSVAFSLIGVFLLIPFSRDKRGIHDHVFGTLVAKGDAREHDDPIPLSSKVKAVVIIGTLLPAFGSVYLRAKATNPSMRSDMAEMTAIQAELAEQGMPQASIQTRSFSISGINGRRRTNSVDVSLPMVQNINKETFKKKIETLVLPRLREGFSRSNLDVINIHILTVRYYGLLAVTSNENFSYKFDE